MQFVVVLICLDLIVKKQWIYMTASSIWGTSRKTTNIWSLQSGLYDVNPDLNKEKLQQFKPKKGNWMTWAELLSPFVSEVATQDLPSIFVSISSDMSEGSITLL